MFRISGASKVAVGVVAGLLAAGSALAQQHEGDQRFRHQERQQQAAPPQQQFRPQAAPRVFQPQVQQHAPQFRPQVQQFQAPQFQPRPQPQVEFRRPVEQPSYRAPPRAPNYYRAPAPVPYPVETYPAYQPYPAYEPYPAYQPYQTYEQDYPVYHHRRCVIRRVWVDTRFGPRRVKRRICR